MNASIPQHSERRSRALRQRLLAVAVGLFATVPAAANIPIPEVPLQAGAEVPPNIWFILDDSGSMADTNMPDNDDRMQINSTGTDIDALAYTSNTLSYNPYRTYTPWQTATGTLPDASYTAAFNSTTLASGSTTNLLDNAQVFYVPKAGVTNLSLTENYWRYRILTTGALERCERTFTTSWGWRLCTSVTGDGDAVVYPSPVGRTLAQERQNYANWYVYHRTRSKVAKAGASAAFADLPEDVRVGFTTIWNRSTFQIPVGTDSGLFRGANKSTWFDRLHNATASSTTPLRGALGAAKTYFENSTATGPWGPGTGTTQLACRQNFSILTTDGYWNGDSGWNSTNHDNTAGPTITGPKGETYTYSPAFPYRDTVGGTLADQAMLNWRTDLRPDMVNNVPYSPANPAFWQHLVTFGISIGLRGTLDPKVDLPALRNGTKVWPDPTDAEDLHRIDDLFHAAVNGRGDFVEATDPVAFRDGLKAALDRIVAETLSNSNVAANSTSFSSDSRVFQAGFVSGTWKGELSAFPLSASGVSATPSWRASTALPVWTSRRIFTSNGVIGQTFPTVTQAATLTPDVVNYLKGDQSKEVRESGGTLRNRDHALGDIINSSPIFDPETNTVFVGSNGGMLHAFSGENGAERFAYVPAGLNFANLKSYSDPEYKHRFFVDGQVVVSSRRQTPNRSIVVGALGRGGKGVFALDATTPASFNGTNVLWDKTGSAAEANMGLVIGRPVIAKLNNGETGVIVPNGVNSANNRAVLLIYNLNTGALIAQIDTGVGSSTTPNGLSSPAVYDAGGDGTVDFIFAGDLLGNLWRFNVSNSSPTVWQAAGSRSKLFNAGSSKPITAAPALALNPKDFKLWVFFGTGRYLAEGDPGDASTQTWYGMRDSSTEITTAELQRRTIQQQATASGRLVRTFESPGTLDAGKKGWFIDLLRPPYPPGVAEGERMITNQRVVGRTLIASSVIPSPDPCDAGGNGFINAIDAFSGASLSSSFFDLDGDGDFSDETVGGKPVGSIDLDISMPTEAALVESILVVGGSRSTTASVPVDLSSLYGRISWREVVQD